MSDMQSYSAHQPPSYNVSTFFEAVRAFFAKYATFSGRANRPEYWYSTLFIFLANIISAIVDRVLIYDNFGYDLMSPIVTLVLFIPSLSVSVRRLHDIDRTGWWLLLGLIPILGWIVLIVFACQKGTAGANRFG